MKNKTPESVPLPKRAEFFELIAKGSIYGNLGLFIGAGLPMAIFNTTRREVALSWGELIRRCAKELAMPYGKVKKIGNSYPQIASQLCKIISKRKQITYEAAVDLLKQKIAKLTSLYPEIEDRKRYKGYFDTLDPKWVITTNYDTVIECILTGKSIAIAPENELVAPRNYIPVYHLHGIRTIPDSIIITQEDYISLFRPTQYRLQKLPLIIKESTTLIMGYGLGDFNVLTALDWSKNVFKSESTSYPNNMLQLVHSEDPRQEPYYDNDILVLEFEDLEELLGEICEAVQAYQNDFEKNQGKLNNLEDKYLNPTDQTVQQFVDDAEKRLTILNRLTANDNFFINGFLELLLRSIELSWKRARAHGAFEAYNQNLILILDILERINIQNTPPALIEMLVDALNRLSGYIGLGLGESHSAFRTWQRRKNDLSEEIVSEIKNISSLRKYYRLSELLEEL